MSWLRKRRERREQRAFEEKLQADMSAYWTNATLEAARLRAPVEPTTAWSAFDALLFTPAPSLAETVAAQAVVLEVDASFDLADLRRLALYTIEPPL
jgi:hypothetical protein